MTEQEYFAVGELAQRVGVTVRTIQYYDQAGLLSPSAKGPQNQRLYTEEDLQDLYRILTLKYLGFSLAEIKEDLSKQHDGESFYDLANQQMDEIEKNFQQIFKRLTTLRSLMDKTKNARDMPLDWQDIAQTIEACQDESQFFWRLTGIREEERKDGCPLETPQREEHVSKWHELIADTLHLASEGVDTDSPESRDLARRYLELDDSQQAISVNQNFILMQNMAPHHHGGSSFDSLRDTVSAYLEQAVEAYQRSSQK